MYKYLSNWIKHQLLEIQSKSELAAVVWKGNDKTNWLKRTEEVRASCFADGNDPVDKERLMILVKWKITKGTDKQCQEIYNCPIFQCISPTKLLLAQLYPQSQNVISLSRWPCISRVTEESKQNWDSPVPCNFWIEKLMRRLWEAELKITQSQRQSLHHHWQKPHANWNHGETESTKSLLIQQRIEQIHREK